MPHVGVERLPPGGAKDHLGEHEEAGQAVVQHEFQGVPGIDRRDDGGHGADGDQPGNRQGGEPDDHDGAEGAGHPVGPLGLGQEEHHRDDGGDQDQGVLADPFQAGYEHHPLHGRQDRDGRGDDAVAQQEAGADVGEEGDEGHLSSRLDQPGQDLPQDDGAPLPFAAQAHGEPGVFRCDQDGHGPEDQGEDAEDVVDGRFGEREDDGESVDGAGADVAEDESHCPDDTFPIAVCFRISHCMFLLQRFAEGVTGRSTSSLPVSRRG